MDIIELTASALARAVASRQVSCREVMSAYLRRIADANPVYNALVSLRDPDELLQEADICDAMLSRGDGPVGWMHGMPQAIKDLSPAAGIRMTLGSPLMRDLVPAEDGLMTQRMKAAGCIVIGKSNTPEFGLGSNTFNEVFGATRNPYDVTRSAGGSSGGAAVALATRMLPVADGSDFMGSLRNPAGWNNIFGLRPSQGRVPTWPAADVWVSQLGTEGPMGRSVEDVARLLDVISGPDARTPLALARHGSFADGLSAHDGANATIGWLGDLNGYLPFEPGILSVCEDALARLASIGCRVEPTARGFEPGRVWRAWLVWRRWLVASRIAPFLKTAAHRDLIKPEALWEYDQASTLSGADVFAASQQRSAFYQHLLSVFGRFDVLALPSAQVWPFPLSMRWPQEIDGRAMDTYHRWMEVVIYATFAGLPCISIPAGFSPGGLPMGLQLIGRPQDEESLLRVAHAYEQASQDILAIRPAV